MQFLGRFKNIKSQSVFYGEYDKDTSLVQPIESLFHSHKTGSPVPVSDVIPLCPVSPSKIVCVGRNYRAHIQEFGGEEPAEPLLFLKANSSLNGPNEKIIIPPISHRVEYEGELVVVIGKIAKNVKSNESLNYVLGFSIGNDVTARDIQRKDGQWARGKSFDTFCPIGPWVLKYSNDLNIDSFLIRSYLNGNMLQDSLCEKMIFKVNHLISYISHCMTLFPGDVIMTGTPSGVGSLKQGDEIKISIDPIGELVNLVS